MIRLAALDLDGTLLGPDWQVGDADRDAVVAARDRGVHIVLNTSRWYGIAKRTARRLQLRDPLICHNGAHIKEPDDGADLLHLTVPQDAALEITAFCDERGYETYTTVDAITYMRSRWEDRIDPARLPKDMRIAKTHREHVTGPVSGIVIFSEEAVRLITDTFGEPYDGVLAFPVGRSESMQPYVTVTAAGADKGNALQLVCERLGVPADEVIAMGDAAPDIAMFELAKIGVAMGNAPDDVKAQADAVAPSNADAGVAWALRRFVLEA